MIGLMMASILYKKDMIQYLTASISDAEVEKSFCEKWLDVRSFGQVITYDKRSIGIRGPVSIAIAKSLSPIEISSLQITRSTNGMDTKDGKRSSDTMGLKHFVEYGVYVVVGSVNCFLFRKDRL
jgi:Cas7 group CRISPR-associated protein Csh2